MAAIMADREGLVHVSTGDVLRGEMKQGTELGAKARQYVESGDLVPDELVAAIVSCKLGQTDIQNNGVILDGYPRTVPQAHLLDGALAENGLSLTAVVLFEVEEELLLKRLTSRRLCGACREVYNIIFSPPRQEGVCDACGGELIQRPDDSLETAKERLLVYQAQTSPLVSLYEERGLLVRTTGGEEREANFRLMKEALGS